jgi:hypothetical protein
VSKSAKVVLGRVLINACDQVIRFRANITLAARPEVDSLVRAHRGRTPT